MSEENQPVEEAQSQDSGLLDSVNLDDSPEQTEDPTQTVVEHLQKTEEDDEPLERPDWWPENFWKKDASEPDLEGIAKSWMDLRKQISQGKHKPPADGKYDTSAFGDIPSDDPVRQHVESWAREYGISQAAFDRLVGDVVSMQGDREQVVQRTIEQEKQALGPNADQIIKGMVDWASGLVRKGVWGKDDFEEFKQMGGTAGGIKALMKLREAYEPGRLPTSSVPVDGMPSKEELYQMVADPKYKEDAAYRQKVERMFQQVFS